MMTKNSITQTLERYGIEYTLFGDNTLIIPAQAISILDIQQDAYESLNRLLDGLEKE